MKSHRGGAIVLAAVLAVSAFAIALAGGTLGPGASLAAELNPVSASDECPQGTAGFKIDETTILVAGTYTFGDWSVTIYDVQVSGEPPETVSFSFKDASQPVMYVFAKAGTGGTPYDYRPNGVTAATGLTAGGKGVSHITFCFGEAPPSSAPPSSAPSSAPPSSAPPSSAPPSSAPPSSPPGGTVAPTAGGATPTLGGAVGGETGTPVPTLPATNTLESTAHPGGNLPVVLLVLLAIGSIVIGATVLRPRPIRTRR